jgi:hypothetical protein
MAQNKILAIDPGDQQSAFVVWDGETIFKKGLLPNHELIDSFLNLDCDKMAIEMIASYGMPVGKTVFETCVWIGRFVERFLNTKPTWPPLDNYVTYIYRKDVKMHLCGTTKAKDGNIRQALIDRFGECGTKKNPGKLYGVSKDIWAALALAVTYTDTL